MAETTAIRGKDWVFNAFWAATLANRSSTQYPGAKLILNIPITSIFKKGQPIKTLITNPLNGVVERVNLEEIVVERSESDRGFRGDNYKTLRALRKLLIDFSDFGGYAREQSVTGGQEEIFVCKVILT